MMKSEAAELDAKVQRGTTALAGIENRIKMRGSEFNRFNMACQRLEEHDISIDEIEKLSNMLENAKEHGMDVKGIVDTSSQIKSLKKALSSVSSEVKRANEQLREFKADGNELAAELLKKDSEIKAANRLHASGFDAQRIDKLHSIILRVSAAHKIPQESAVERFFNSIAAEYDSKLGLERKCRELDERSGSLITSVNTLELRYAAKREVIEAVETLHSYNLKEDDIIYLSRIVSAATEDGTGPDEKTVDLKLFAKEIEGCGGVRKSNIAYLKKNAELLQSIQERTARVESLKVEEARIVQHIDGLQNITGTWFKNSMTQAKNQFDEGSQSIRKSTNEAVKSIQSSVVILRDSSNQILHAQRHNESEYQKRLAAQSTRVIFAFGKGTEW